MYGRTVVIVPNLLVKNVLGHVLERKPGFTPAEDLPIDKPARINLVKKKNRPVIYILVTSDSRGHGSVHNHVVKAGKAIFNRMFAKS